MSKISILMPIYNGIEFIEESVSSVLAQTYTDWELIIGVNGFEEGSPTYLIAKEYEKRAAELGKIRVLDLFAIKGKSDALNEMVKCHCSSQSSYIAILDVDDAWTADKLKTQAYYLDIYDVIGSRCVYFGDKEGTIPAIPTGDISLFDFTKVNPVINSSSLVRKELCQWNGQTVLEDYDLWLRLRKLKKRFFNCPTVLVRHRIHKTSAFNNTNHQHVAELVKTYICPKN